MTIATLSLNSPGLNTDIVYNEDFHTIILEMQIWKCSLQHVVFKFCTETCLRSTVLSRLEMGHCVHFLDLSVSMLEQESNNVHLHQCKIVILNSIQFNYHDLAQSPTTIFVLKLLWASMDMEFKLIWFFKHWECTENYHFIIDSV